MLLECGKTYDFVTADRKKGGGQLVLRIRLSGVKWSPAPAHGWGGGVSRGSLWFVGMDAENRRVSIPSTRILDVTEAK